MLAIVLAIVIFVLSALLAWLAGPLLGIVGTSLLVLRIILVALGSLAAGIILFFYFRDRRRDAATRNMPGGSDLDTLLRDAEHRLATAQRTGPKSLDSLPLLYILGDANSAKTTAVIKSGFDPELLYLARHHGLRTVEIPVRWGHSPATKVNMFRDSIRMFVDVFTIRWNSVLGRYPRSS